MWTRRLMIPAGVAAALLLTPTAALAAPGTGGCQAFGQNVSSLATGLGPLFGATASGVASSAPGAFPALVVKPEQAKFCTP